MGLGGKAEASGPDCGQFHRELGGRFEPREADSPAVATGALSSIIDPDHNFLGSVLSGYSQIDHEAWGGPRLLTAYHFCLVLACSRHSAP